jgi:hypothetical protein
MARRVWICRDRCGDKSHQLFTTEPTDECGEWYSYIGTGSIDTGSSGTGLIGAGTKPGRPTSVYLPRSVAVSLAGRELAPGAKVEIPLEPATKNLRESRSLRPTRPVRKSA